MAELDQLSLIMHWEGACHLTFDLCLKMPKNARFSFAQRLEGGALDMLTTLYSARYLRGDHLGTSLRQADVLLAQLRALARLAHARQLISHTGFDRLSSAYDEAGRMLGGWMKSVNAKLSPHIGHHSDHHA